MPLPAEGSDEGREEFKGVVDVLCEFVDLCIDWERVVLSEQELAAEDNAQDNAQDGADIDVKRRSVRSAMQLLVASAIRSGESKEVIQDVDKERSGIAMWRIP